MDPVERVSKFAHVLRSSDLLENPTVPFKICLYCNLCISEVSQKSLYYIIIRKHRNVELSLKDPHQCEAIFVYCYANLYSAFVLRLKVFFLSWYLVGALTRFRYIALHKNIRLSLEKTSFTH